MLKGNSIDKRIERERERETESPAAHILHLNQKSNNSEHLLTSSGSFNMFRVIRVDQDRTLKTDSQLRNFQVVHITHLRRGVTLFQAMLYSYDGLQY